jgi:formylglycine-generating enzyme required for sulfatase activity
MAEITTKDGASMVLVPAGPFIYGASNERLLHLLESPELVNKVRIEFKEIDEQEVTLDDFYIDVSPVTNAQYMRFLQESRYKKHPSYSTDTRFELPDHPVVRVDWDDATAYAKWAGKALPSEEQWEKAARGTDGRMFPWGDGFDPSRCNCAEVNYLATSPVGRFTQGRSPYGVEDMVGNVWEMTTGSWDGPQKTMRGGCYLTFLSYCHTTMRWTASEEELQQGPKWLGFRCVMALSK